MTSPTHAGHVGEQMQRLGQVVLDDCTFQGRAPYFLLIAMTEEGTVQTVTNMPQDLRIEVMKQHVETLEEGTYTLGPAIGPVGAH